jgi:twitching motility two-component system response regulator PilH
MARILIVDDSLSARQGISQTVGDCGHETIVAANGLEALDLVAEQKPDCMVLDLLMPEMDGFDVLKMLKNRGLKIPVIVLSADIQETTRVECLKLGAFRFLNKPPMAAELMGAIREALSPVTKNTQ